MECSNEYVHEIFKIPKGVNWLSLIRWCNEAVSVAIWEDQGQLALLNFWMSTRIKSNVIHSYFEFDIEISNTSKLCDGGSFSSWM